MRAWPLSGLDIFLRPGAQAICRIMHGIRRGPAKTSIGLFARTAPSQYRDLLLTSLPFLTVCCTDQVGQNICEGTFSINLKRKSMERMNIAKEI